MWRNGVMGSEEEFSEEEEDEEEKAEDARAVRELIKEGSEDALSSVEEESEESEEEGRRKRVCVCSVSFIRHFQTNTPNAQIILLLRQLQKHRLVEELLQTHVLAQSLPSHTFHTPTFLRRVFSMKSRASA